MNLMGTQANASSPRQISAARIWILTLALMATVGFNAFASEGDDPAKGRESAFQQLQDAFTQGRLPEATVELISFHHKYPDDTRIQRIVVSLLDAVQQKTTILSPGQLTALLEMVSSAPSSAEDLWNGGVDLFAKGQYEMAHRYFEAYCLSYWKEPHAASACFNNAECLFNTHKWDDAAKAYRNFALSCPKDRRVPSAIYQIAMCQLMEGNYQESATDFNDFLAKYPKHPLAKDARLNVDLANKKALLGR